MIVPEGNVATTNIDNRHSFSIKASAKAFKLLSSNLYSDKPLAIVREIGCNALDSHFMAGKADVPFKVVLPSEMHPFFEVIDYGTGLSDDQVMNVFTTFFESTKTDSNDQVGAFGLGSKSPFAYTDAFEVFARQDGVQNMYTCFLNQSGAPEIFKLEQIVDPTLENGVTIKVPIKKNDFGLFRTAALKAYKFFPVRPIVGANTVNWNWDEPVYKFHGTNFKTISNDSTVYALMGPVAYPVDLHQLKGDESLFLSNYRTRTKVGFVIKYNIGDLDINAGREALSYDKETIANLIAGMKNIQVEMAKDLQDGIDKCPKLYDAIKFRDKNDPHNVFQLRYAGKLVNSQIIYSFQHLDQTDKYQVRQRHGHWVEKLKSVRASTVNVNPSSGTSFILVDERKLHTKKIRYNKEDISNVYFLINPDPNAPDSKDQFKDEIEKFERDGVPYKFITDMKYEFPERLRAAKDPNQAKRDKVTYSGFYHFIAPFYNAIAVRDYKNLTDGELEDDRVYILWGTKEKRLTINGYKFRADELSQVIWEMIQSAVKKTGKPFVIVTDKVADKIPDNWVDVSTLLKAEIRQCMTKKSFTDIYGHWVMTGLEMDALKYAAIVADPKVNKVFTEFFDPMRKIKFGQPLDYTSEQFIKNTFAISSDITKSDDGLMKFRDKFIKNNLLAKLVGRYYSTWPEADFKDSLVMFSAMISHGIIDETELRSFLK